MKNWFRIGDFPFTLEYPQEVILPENFLRFQCSPCESEYDYTIIPVNKLPRPDGVVAAQREDICVYSKGGLEQRLIGMKGRSDYHACYQETSETSANIVLAAHRIAELHSDTAFTSLLALERRLVQKDALILHCAYIKYRDEAILFSAPSETGKTTQANLWEQYRGSRTINGDKALLQCKDGRWAAQGWPVCGTSEICHNLSTPIRAIVMLSQAKENSVRRLQPIEAFSQLYTQITVNTWNRDFVQRNMDMIEKLIAQVPVYHLACNISENAVACLEAALYPEGTP